MMTNAITIHIFRQGTGRYGYTLDKSGANLTENFHGTPWETVSSTTPQLGEGPRAGPPLAVVQEGIAQDSYYVVDNAVTVTQGTCNA